MADDKKVIFSMVGVSKIIPPQRQILKNIYLSFFYGAKIGIIGLNGSGKSTLLKIIAGLDKSYQGNVVFSPGYSVGYLEQDPKLDPDKTVREVVEEGVLPVMALLKEYDEVNNAFADPEVLEDADKMNRLIERQAELQDKLDAADAWNIDNKLDRAMDALRCPPDDKKISVLSGGERRRVALCRLLLQQPDILLLDEPTNHLDIPSKEALEKALEDYDGTILFVSHDRMFLKKMANRIMEMGPQCKVYNINYEEYLEKKGTGELAEAKKEIKEVSKQEVRSSKLTFNEEKAIKNRIAKLEKLLEEADADLESLRELRFEPEYYQDYRKMEELDAQIDDKHNEIAALTKEWEEKMIRLEGEE